jgi:hypothetical protein
MALTQEWIQEILDAHNSYRSEVGVSNLVWDEGLADEAAAYSSQLSSTGSFQHSSTGDGENLWKGSAGSFSFTDMLESWGNEKGSYNGQTIDNSNFHAFGHYTQLVWSGTTQVGCGGTWDSNGKYTFVCRYNPAGNVIGQKPF